MVTTLRLMSRHEEMSAESRARLIEAAWDLFAENGARRTTVQDIAERARISRGSIAWHFGSKQGLVVAVVDQAFDWLVEQMTEALQRGGTPGWPRVLDAQSLVMAERRYQLFATLGVEALVDQDDVLKAFAAGQERVRLVYADYFRTHDLLPPGTDAVAVAGALRALTLGLNIQRRFENSLISVPEALEALRIVLDRTPRDLPR